MKSDRALTAQELNVTTITVSEHTMLFTVIQTAMQCMNRPHIPRNADEILSSVSGVCRQKLEKCTYGAETFYCSTFLSAKALGAWIAENIMPLQRIQELNLSDKEYAAGVKIDDETRDYFVFTSAYDAAPPAEDDFVDLGAFERNLCHNLIREIIRIMFPTFY